MGLFSKYKENEGRLKGLLAKRGIDDSTIDSMMKQVEAKINEEPSPRIAFIGFTGVGKSTTLNALFNAGQPTSDIRACTQKEAEIIGDVSKYTGSKGSVIVYDMPGLGEDRDADKRHIETYKRVLPIVDLIVWTFHTGDRAMTPMQEAIIKLSSELGTDFQDKLMFAINKADAIAPGESDWNTRVNIPSKAQKENIKELEQYIKEKIHQVLPRWDGSIVTYSAKKRYRLEELMTAMIESMPSNRRWVLDAVADVANMSELIAPQYRELIESKRRSATK